MSDAAQLRLLNTLLAAALEVPEEARDAWLSRLSPQHAPLAPRLATMLARLQQESGSFLRRPLGVSLDDLHTLDAGDPATRGRRRAASG